MFLEDAVPDSGREIARYRAWLEPAFNAVDFGRLYSDLFGHPIAHVVHDRTPLTDLIHETLLDCARQGRPLVQLLARAVRARRAGPSWSARWRRRWVWRRWSRSPTCSSTTAAPMCCATKSATRSPRRPARDW